MVANFGYNPLLNPNLNPQQRLYQYETMQMPQMNMQMRLNPYYVTSRNEAEASQTPFDGSTNIFLNTSKNEVYIKKLANNGSADFKVYTLVDDSEKKNELTPIIERLDNYEKSLNEIKSEIDRLNKYPINKAKKEVKDVQ